MFYKSFMAGLMIALAGVANLSVMPSPLGAFLFPVGILIICGEGYALYTGQVRNLVNYKINYNDILIILIGNLIGAFWIGWLAPYFGVEDMAQVVCDSISNLSMEELLVRSIGCGLFITVGCEAYDRGEWWTLFLCIVAFVITGMRHSIADAFYWVAASRLPLGIVPESIVIIGNAIGGIAPGYLKKFT